jgi:gluconokinase
VWFPVITDGFASNYGAGATDPTRMAAATATSGALRVLLDQPADPLPFGLWNYRVDGSRTLLGGALNDVGRAISWARATLDLGEQLGPALTGDPSAGTPLVLPYFTGERAPGWMAGAQAIFAGVSGANTPEELFRGIVEGVAITYDRVGAELSPAAPDALQIMAAGSVSKDMPDWLQILADVLERPVTHVTTKRATLRGTALIALETLAPDVPRAPATTGNTYEPKAGRAAYYAERKQDFDKFYATLIQR